jgi:hypothetical protein
MLLPACPAKDELWGLRPIRFKFVLYSHVDLDMDLDLDVDLDADD